MSHVSPSKPYEHRAVGVNKTPLRSEYQRRVRLRAASHVSAAGWGFLVGLVTIGIALPAGERLSSTFNLLTWLGLATALAGGVLAAGIYRSLRDR